MPNSKARDSRTAPGAANAAMPKRIATRPLRMIAHQCLARDAFIASRSGSPVNGPAPIGVSLGILSPFRSLRAPGKLVPARVDARQDFPRLLAWGKRVVFNL